MHLDLRARTIWVKDLASRHGFMGAGMSRVRRLDAEADRLEKWLGLGYHGEMAYMANHFEMRVDPGKLVPGAKSVISLMYNYYPDGDTRVQTEEKPIGNDIVPKIARYAYGEDYHKVVRRKLKAMMRDMKDQIGDFSGRVFVDSGPVMERDWAQYAGLGWVGKNTLLLHPREGSYFFLAEIICDLDFEYDHPIRNHCGTCTRCIDACPTDAIAPEGFVLDASKCISYLTIELKEAIPPEFHDKMEDWIFGCDICQEVCPWNRFSKPHQEPAFQRSNQSTGMSIHDWKEITDEVFEHRFGHTPLKRAGWKKIWENINTTMFQS